MPRLASLTLRRLELPLGTPYKLAFGAVEAFDTILVQGRDEDGRAGFGEATILTGYTEETVAGSWAAACRTAQAIAGLETEAAEARAAQLIPSHPFAATAIVTALEMLRGHPLLRPEGRASVPLIAILNAMAEPEIEQEIEARLAEGYRTLKVKVGFDADRDLARVRFIQRAVAGRAVLRIDGNQGYAPAAGLGFAAALDPAGIELLEQPCAAGDWQAAAALAEVSAVPMMLDESIYGLDDIDRAADLRAARFVKLKLMKMGGLTRLAEGIARIERHGMAPVLGNGVAAGPGCWMEACVAGRSVETAGEMNGFLKPRGDLLKQPLAVSHGSLVLPPEPPEIDEAALEAATRERASFPDGAV